MKIFKKESGFKLIELMIVVAIIGILAAVAIPKFANMLEKAKEGATKGNLGALKSAISIYYGDNEGDWPDQLAGKFDDYMDRIPPVKVKHPGAGFQLAGDSNAVTVHLTTATFATNTDGWRYNSQTGDIWLNNAQTDSKGTNYSYYGTE